MKAVFTAEQMRQSERRLFDTGVSSISLMERAAEKLVQRALELLPEHGTCVFACGSGGNGGDGYAAARLLSEKGARAVVIYADFPKTPDAETNMRAAKDKVFAMANTSELERLPRPELWVDCLFGTGLKRAPEGNYRLLIDRINRDKALGSKVLSCDIPSGLDSNTGEVYGACVEADVTVSFQAYKRGQLLGEGMNLCGVVELADIGIPEGCYPESYARLVEDADAIDALPARKRTAHKNDFGHLLIIAGSRGMAGAAAISASTALKSGAGLVTIACPESILNILQTLVPCAMCIALPEKDGAISDEAAPLIMRVLEGKSAVAIGPGLSMRASRECVRLVLESRLKSVIDADALNIIAGDEGLKALLSDCHAITPHPGEAKRLLKESFSDAVACAHKLAELGCAALLKGACSVIVGKSEFLSASGCVGMAKGGSGDALTGIVGALLAQGMDTETALWAASQIHGRAGELAQAKHGERSMLATDLVNCIGEAFENAARG